MALASVPSAIVTLEQRDISGEQVIFIGPAALVASKSNPGRWFIVEDGRCTCPGYTYRGTCRHLAPALEAAELDRQSAAPAVIALDDWRCAAPTIERRPIPGFGTATTDYCSACGVEVQQTHGNSPARRAARAVGASGARARLLKAGSHQVARRALSAGPANASAPPKATASALTAATGTASRTTSCALSVIVAPPGG